MPNSKSPIRRNKVSSEQKDEIVINMIRHMFSVDNPTAIDVEIEMAVYRVLGGYADQLDKAKWLTLSEDIKKRMLRIAKNYQRRKKEAA